VLAALGCKSTTQVAREQNTVQQAVAMQPNVDASSNVVPAAATVAPTEPVKTSLYQFDSPFSSAGACSH
jgi:hypothetical protein